GERGADTLEQLAAGARSLDAGQRRRGIDHVAVDGLAPEDERRRLERPGSGDADVDDGLRPPLLEHAGGSERSLDRSDPAAEGVEAVEKRELALGGGNHDHLPEPRSSGDSRRVLPDLLEADLAVL